MAIELVTTDGIFACEWKNNELVGRNEAVGGHYVIGFRERPEQAREGVALSAGRVLLWILLVILVLIVLSLMFGGFQKGTKATGPGALPRVPERVLLAG